jgi:hypothetical protein
MFQIGDTVVSRDVIEEDFFCELNACKGICCVEGDAGAPVENDELPLLNKILPIVWDDLSPAAQAIIKKQGVAYIDDDGEYVTSIVDGKDCVFTCYDERGNCLCAIEKAYRKGLTDFYKPVSCHLYPIRVAGYKDFKAVNYHHWDICKAATTLGKSKSIKIYQFLKEPLIRKFGEEWYEQLCLAADYNENL